MITLPTVCICELINFAVSIAPEPSLSWYRDDVQVEQNEKYQVGKENLGTCHFDVQKLEFVDQVSKLDS